MTLDSTGLHVRSTTTATCRTAEPILLTMNYDGPLTLNLAFGGATTIPRLTGCGLLGPTLGTLLSGPGNDYQATLDPPS